MHASARRLLAAAFVPLVAALPAAAQSDDEATFRLGPDLYRAGETVALDTADIDDVFSAGNIVTLQAPAQGSVHLAGRRVELAA